MLEKLRFKARHWTIRLPGRRWVTKESRGILFGNGKARTTVWLSWGIEPLHHTEQYNVDAGGFHVRWHVEHW